MLYQAIQTEKVNRILRLLTKLLGVPMVFYDVDDNRIEEFGTRVDLAYCSKLRQNPDFDALCVVCDRDHLKTARRKKEPIIYECHHGLTEGIVPLFGQNREYLGGIIFGQIRKDSTSLPPEDDPLLTPLFKSLPVYDLDDVMNITSLVEYFAEYMMQNHLIRYNKPPWVEILKTYINEHTGEDLSLKQLSKVCGYSSSFIAHNFKKEFRETPHKYILNLRIRKAKELLEQGYSVKATALDTGFHDAYHFSNTFKRECGVYPSRYRGKED